MANQKPTSNDLQQSLSQLHTVLVRTPSVGESSKRLLREVLNDIERLLRNGDAAPVARSATPAASLPRLEALAPSLAMVTFDMPYSVSGITERNYHGTGLVVDAQRGLVVVDRNTVPVAVGDVTITFAGTVQVPGHVVYVHPQHNLAVVAYDPKLVGSTPVKSAKLAPRELGAGESVWVVGLGADSEIRSRNTQIASIDQLELPLSPPWLVRMPTGGV